MHGNSTVSVVVEGAGKGVVAHVGLHALGAVADRLGLGDSLSARIPVTGERLPLHDRGKVLSQAMLMLAGGGEACADIEQLRSQETLFGPVPSDSTLYRTFRQIDPVTLAGLWAAMGEVRAQVWRRASATTGTATVVLDIDASLHQIHSENKQETAATTRAASGSTRSTASMTRPARRSAWCCGPATPGRTASPIMSPCWTGGRPAARRDRCRPPRR